MDFTIESMVYNCSIGLKIVIPRRVIQWASFIFSIFIRHSLSLTLSVSLSARREIHSNIEKKHISPAWFKTNINYNKLKPKPYWDIHKNTIWSKWETRNKIKDKSRRGEGAARFPPAASQPQCYVESRRVRLRAKPLRCDSIWPVSVTSRGVRGDP